jgi:hypothetical protein
MKQLPIQLPDSFIKGLICKVHVSLNGKTGTKELKVCMVKARSITFIEVDRENRQNIFRKVDRKDIVNFKPTAICEITVRDGILPVKWESAWDSIGQPTQQIRGRGLASQFSKHFSNHSKGWAPTIKAPMGSSIDALAANPSWKNSTTNSAAGFPMV